jgi:hypothetical protein
MKYIKLFESFKINEGRYDKISNYISSEIFNKWKEDFNKGRSESVYKELIVSEDIEVDVVATLYFTPGIEKLKVDGGVEEEVGYLQIDFEVDPDLLPTFWEEISMNLKDVVRHELEHLTHSEGYNLNPAKELPNDLFIRDMIRMDLMPHSEYFKLLKEVDANLQGMYFRAKKEKVSFRSVIDNYLDAQNITPIEKEEILNIWRERLSALNLPNF